MPFEMPPLPDKKQVSSIEDKKMEDKNKKAEEIDYKDLDSLNKSIAELRKKIGEQKNDEEKSKLQEKLNLHLAKARTELAKNNAISDINEMMENFRRHPGQGLETNYIKVKQTVDDKFQTASMDIGGNFRNPLELLIQLDKYISGEVRFENEESKKQRGYEHLNENFPKENYVDEIKVYREEVKKKIIDFYRNDELYKFNLTRDQLEKQLKDPELQSAFKDAKEKEYKKAA